MAPETKTRPAGARLARRAPALLLLVPLVLGAAPLASDEARVPVQWRDKLFAVRFASPETAWAVGDVGLVLTSRDAGMHWERRESGVRVPLYDVAFADARTGVAVGAEGTILRTADGGASWERVDADVAEDLLAVDFATPEHGFAVGLFATVLETVDGGASWTRRDVVEGSVAEEHWEELDTQLFTAPLLNDVAFVDERHGWIVGEFGLVLATQDGGASWHRQRTGEQAILFACAFASPAEGWAVGLGGLVLHTTDGGAGWSRSAVPTVESLYDVAVAGGRRVAVGDAGTLLQGNDPSLWEPGEGEGLAFGWLRSVASADGRRWIAVGAHGAVLVSDDGGRRWRAVR